MPLPESARAVYDRLHAILEPMHVFPDLVDEVPASLAKRRQGKSWFTFTNVNDEQVRDLEAFTESALNRYRQNRFL